MQKGDYKREGTQRNSGVDGLSFLLVAVIELAKLDYAETKVRMDDLLMEWRFLRSLPHKTPNQRTRQCELSEMLNDFKSAEWFLPKELRKVAVEERRNRHEKAGI